MKSDLESPCFITLLWKMFQLRASVLFFWKPGARVGHRSLMRYYKQRFGLSRAVAVAKNQKAVGRVLQQYRALGWTGSTGTPVGPSWASPGTWVTQRGSRDVVLFTLSLWVLSGGNLASWPVTTWDIYGDKPKAPWLKNFIFLSTVAF